MNWLQANKEWFFSGAGVFVVAAIGRWVYTRWLAQQPPGPTLPSVTTAISDASSSISNQTVINIGQGLTATPAVEMDLDVLKAKTHVLFIDDDARFRVVDILTKCGWIHTRKVRDVMSIDDDRIIQANILFIDIHGVGRKLDFRAEGLGLAAAIKEKYPEKKVVIYSAETQGDRFHEALRKADDFLAKNADPYEFQQLTERLAREVHAKR